MSSQSRALAMSCAVVATMSLAAPLVCTVADGGGASTVRSAHDRSEVA